MCDNTYFYEYHNTSFCKMCDKETNHEISYAYSIPFYEEVISFGTNKKSISKLNFDGYYNIVIQTFGSNQLHIDLYDEVGNLVDSGYNEGLSGNPLVSFYSDCDIDYYLVIYYTASSLSTNSKLTITSIEKSFSLVNNLGFADFYNISYSDFRQINSTGYLYESNTYDTINAFIFKPSVSGYYEFEVEATTDCFVYVIDPVSSIVNANNENDYQRIYINCNKFYFVMFGQVDTSGCLDCDEHDTSIMLYITKN